MEEKDLDKITELTEQVNKLQAELKENKDIIDALNLKLEDKDKILAENTENIKELKLKNYDLLLQVGQPMETVKEEPKEPCKSLQEITDILKGE